MLLLQNYDRLVAALDQECTEQVQRPRIVCVSKEASTEEIEALATKRQQFFFGENRVEALKQKSETLEHLPITWIYLGALQSRKIKTIVQYAQEVHSLASWKDVELLVNEVQRQNKASMRCFLQMNLGAASRRGFHPSELKKLLDKKENDDKLRDIKSTLNICGLMSILPQNHSMHFALTAVPAQSYYYLRFLQKQASLPELSLGMSLDWKAGLAAGATDIRIGRLLFNHKLLSF